MHGSNLFPVLGLITLASLAGCAAAPQVSPAGGGGYQVSATGSRFDAQASTNRRALSVASAYCGSQHKALLFRQSQESGEHRFSPKREDLTFTCISAADPGYLNAGLRRDTERSPDPVVARQ